VGRVGEDEMVCEIADAPPQRRGFPAVDLARDALLLDIDGTIIDIAPTPDAVVVPESLELNLGRVREKLDGALALITGRMLAAADELFAPLTFAAVGCHGAEVRTAPGGKIEQVARPLSAVEKAAFAEAGKFDPRIRIEDKHYTLAIHYRRVPELENELFGYVNGTLQRLGADLEMVLGKAVIELKPPGVTKGTGVEHLMAVAPFAGRRPVFFGDDTTDEDAFAELPKLKGIGVSVGRLLPGADRCVPAPKDVRNWLAQLAGSSS